MSKKSTKRRNAVIAGVAAAALFMGGSTYALWSSNATITGGEITGGDLNLQAGKLTAWDVSVDRTDWQGDGTNSEGKITIPATLGTNNQTIVPAVTLQSTSYSDLFPPDEYPLDEYPEYAPNTSMPYGHQIKNMDTWTMIPGDMVAIAFPVKVTLKGDNLIAVLGFMMNWGPDPDQDYPTNWCHSTLINPRLSPIVSYQLFGGDGQALGGIEGLCVEGQQSNYVMNPVVFQANNAGQESGIWEGGIGPDDEQPMTMATVDEDGTATVVLVLYLNFWASIGESSEGEFMDQMLYDFENGLSAGLYQIRCDINNRTDWNGNPYPNNFTVCPN